MQPKVRREKVLHRKAFNAYADMGDSRSLPRVADKFGVSIQAVKQWSRSHGWKARVKARDKENAELRPEDIGLDKATVKRLDAVASTVGGDACQITKSTQDGADKAVDIPRGKKGEPERDRDIENLALIDGLKEGAAHLIKSGVLCVETVQDLATLLRAEGYVTGRDSESFINKDTKPFIMIQAMVKDMHINGAALAKKALKALSTNKNLEVLPGDVIDAEFVEVVPERPSEIEPKRIDRPRVVPKKKRRPKRASA